MTFEKHLHFYPIPCVFAFIVVQLSEICWLAIIMITLNLLKTCLSY